MALWRVEEAADYLGIRPKTLYEWVRTGRVPHRKLGFNVRFDPDELESWVASQPGGKPARRPRRAAATKNDAGTPPADAELLAVAGEAAKQLRRLESDLGANLSFPQRQEIRDLVERLRRAAGAG